MLRRLWLLLVLLALVSPLPVFPTARAQSTEDAIATRLVLKPLYLRGSWGDDKLHFDGAGQPAQNYKIVPFTIAAVNISKLHLSGDHLYLQGKRVGLAFNAAGAITRVALTRKETLQIEVDAPPSGDFGPALDAIFADGVAEMPAASAGPWQEYAAHHWPLQATGAATTRRDEPTDPTKSVARVGGQVLPPKVLLKKDPVFSEAARGVRYSGAVDVGLTVGPDGVPSNIEIRRPAGMGLDEQAVVAVSQYRFAPATKEGRPIPVEIFINVNFQIFTTTKQSPR